MGYVSLSWFCVLLSVHFTRVEDLAFINTKTASHFWQDSRVGKPGKVKFQSDRKRLEEERLVKGEPRWVVYRPGNGLHVLNIVVNTLLECFPLHQGDSIS